MCAMCNRNRELISEETRGGFLIRFYAEPEDMSPRGQFVNEDGTDDEETLSKIEDGTYSWFCAVVVASKAGIDLGTAYVGGCCYESPQDFRDTRDGYYDDMVADAVREAREMLVRLAL